ncbi:hypothetical protein D3C81_1314930 [compost metagenome]
MLKNACSDIDTTELTMGYLVLINRLLGRRCAPTYWGASLPGQAEEAGPSDTYGFISLVYLAQEVEKAGPVIGFVTQVLRCEGLQIGAVVSI